MRKLIYPIGVINIALSMYFAVNINLSTFTDNELSDQKFFLATSTFMALVCWIMYMIDRYETK
jgi:hypothetical protein